MNKNLNQLDNKIDGLTIVIVDDERFMRTLIRQALTIFQDPKTIEAQSGEEAWDIIERYREQIDIVLLDLEMPKINGFETLTKIRACKDPRINSIPVVVLTGNNDLTAVKKASSIGINGYLLKPVNSNRLKETIERAIQTSPVKKDTVDKNLEAYQ